jgi:hypothetical protein
VLRSAGFAPGEEVEVMGHLYRAANDGLPAVHLGDPIPRDEPGLAPGPQDNHDEKAEWADEYRNMTRVTN